ncbi:hypothetical protein Back11_60950 [Paenibacillus baekrokdamisoli]|uniref:Uncharacterized protein n=1 Tax=Paenibacillus baekrokdamisoli TaxID=1712516 RepID=A0A3G9J0Q9_9BACL|nr:MFS transporter [Paenibacillus baekrokdamisoli]MBB3072167.1 MFS family permease [Paenibacillus baekrokdamisoli]BBH24750.1 hypothetical protein Back11_60950 [Paenibacillus baekrokdamisoli]
MSNQLELQNNTKLIEKPEKLWTSTFIALTLSFFLLFLCLQMQLAPLPSYVKDQFHSGNFVVSLLTSLFALAAIVSRFATAILMRKYQRNLLLFIGLFLTAVSTATISFTDSITVLLFLRVGFGIGFGMSSTILPTLVSQIIPRSRLGEGVGYFGLSTSLAMSFGPMIGLSMLAGYGFPSLTTLSSVIVIIIIPTLVFSRSLTMKPVQAPDERNSTATATRKPITKSSRKFLLPAILNALFSITYGGLLSFIALFAKEVHLAHIGLFFLFNALSVLIIRPISGRLFDRRGHMVLLIPGALFIIASLTILSYAHTFPSLVISALLYGLGLGVIQPATQAWMLKESPLEKHGMVNSMFYNSTDLGVALGAMLLGSIASVSSYAVMYRYAASIMLVFLLVYGCILLVGNKKKPQLVK